MGYRTSVFSQTLHDGQGDIFRFARILNFHPTPQQAELFKDVQFQTFAERRYRKKGIFVKSGQGPGKTVASAVVAQWRTLQGVNEQTIVTAPTMRQVEDVWMTALSRLVSASTREYQRLIQIVGTKATFCGLPKWGIFTATSSRPENLQGYHSPGLTVLVDEASGIARPIWRVIKGTTTQDDNLIVGIGNPNDRDTEFFDAFNKDVALYSTHTWNAEDSPNVSKEHILAMQEEYGIESDVYRVRVLGEFPRESPVAVIRYEDLLACIANPFGQASQVVPPEEHGRTRRQFGIDLARFGSDESVVVARYNSAVVGMRTYVKREPEDVIDDAFRWQKMMKWPDEDTYFVCDAGGMGQGVMSKFYRNNKKVTEFHFHGSPYDSRMFHDAITEAYFTLRRLTRSRSIHLKRDATLQNQLVSRQYRYTDGLFRLESKDEYMKRVGSDEYTSPDRADALALAFYPYIGALQV